MGIIIIADVRDIGQLSRDGGGIDMTENLIEQELKTCGKAFFIEYFPVLNQIDWHNDEQINLTKQNILDDLKYKRRPDGGNYTKTGLDMRFTSFFVIFSQGLQWEALENISKSKGIPDDIRTAAKHFIKQEFQRLATMEAEKNWKQQEAERQAEEEAYRKRQEQLKLEEENRRKQAEKLAQLAAQKEKYAILIKLRKEQEMIIAANRGWFWSKKAKVRRAAQSKLREIERELDSLPAFDEIKDSGQ